MWHVETLIFTDNTRWLMIISPDEQRGVFELAKYYSVLWFSEKKDETKFSRTDFSSYPLSFIPIAW
jgi:hypothetical protein